MSHGKGWDTGVAGGPWGGRGSLGTLVQWGQDRSSLLPPRQTGGFCHFPPLHNQGWGKPVGNYSLENTLLFKASTSFPSAPGQHHPQVYGEGTLLQQLSSLDLTLHPPALCSSTAQVGVLLLHLEAELCAPPVSGGGAGA